MRASKVFVGAIVLLFLALNSPPLSADAHTGGETLITIGAGEDGFVQIEASVPSYQWRAALTAEGRDPESLEAVVADRPTVDEYILSRVALADPEGPIPLSLTSIELTGSEIDLTLKADPQGRDLDKLELTWTLISDVVVTEYALVSTAEWPQQNGADSTQLVASITHLKPTLAFSLGDAPVVPRATALELGFDHFRRGLDHVSIMVILAVGLTASWSRPRSSTLVRPRPRQLAVGAVMTSLAFAVGHSISLVISSTTTIAIPIAVIEISIAATIALGALHALAADRGLLGHSLGLLPIAAIGLIHGFGFANALQTTGLTGWNLANAVFLFNVGLELAQLAALALFVPLFVLVANQRTVRTLVLLATLAMSVVWVLGRGGVSWLNSTLPLESLGDFTPEWIAASILLLGGLGRATARARRNRATPQSHSAQHSGEPQTTRPARRP